MEFYLLIAFGCFLLAAYAFGRIDTSGSSETSDFQYDDEKLKLKIGAEVSKAFHEEMSQYCSRHSLTLSDLIRNAVRYYMDTFK